MSQQNLLLTIDIGGDSIKVAEFEFTQVGRLLLRKFAYREYAGDKDESSPDSFEEALRDVIVSNDFSAKKSYVSLSGQNAFIRFVKVPAMTEDKSKIKDIIEFEAKQTIPFAMNEVVWDSQLIESNDPDNPEIEAMFVIIKNEEIDRITNVMAELGIEVSLIEVSPTATCNAARANMIGEDCCEMILNIGGRCSTLIFVDGGRFFVRTIPTAGHTITQQISKEFGISFADAEEMKRRHGFVALGGAYEEPESEVAATVSKIIRNVMTRLHGEINRSINVYRASQKGRKPERLWLAGGSSVMAFTPRFFSEKLRIPVDYLNPFPVVTLDEGINKETLAEVAHVFAEVIGLALRKIGGCPIQISLVPESLKRQNALRLKQPYIYASCAVLLFCLCITYWGYESQLAIAKKKANYVRDYVGVKQALGNTVKEARSKFQSTKNDYDKVKSILDGRNGWSLLFNELQTVTPKNVWYTKIDLQNTEPQKQNVSAAPVEETPVRTGMFGMVRRPSSRPGPSADTSKSSDRSWLILEGNYLVTSKAFSDNYAHDLLMTNIKQAPGDFFSKERDDIRILQLNINNPDSPLNVASFVLAVKLTKPIDKF